MAGAPGTIKPVEGVRVRGVQGRVAVGTWHGQPTTVHKPPGEAAVLGQLQRGVAEGAARLALRRDEVGAAGRVEDVLVGGVHALGVVGVEQRLRRLALAAPGASFQARLSASCTPLLRAARAERRDAVRAVAGEEHAAVPEVLHAQACEACRR